MELRVLFRRWVWIVGALALMGQEPPSLTETAQNLLEYAGKPLRLPFRCTESDIQWAGMSCTQEEPCPVYLELAEVEAVGNRLFAAGNIHSQTVTLYSAMLGSDDSGRTWRESHQRIRGAGLDHIQFADFENGWASGEALSPLPQDPFLLITVDGGKTWRQHLIFSETRVGSIQQLQFRSKNDGSLVIDRGRGSEGERYEWYESPNAGDTWTIKQASNQPIQLKGTLASPALWRVQADGPTQSFRIEHQQGGRWGVTAAFAVNLGVCAPAPVESKAPDEPADSLAPIQELSRPATAAPPKRPRR